MTTTADLWAPPFVLDVRVARSPMVGLRYSVDGRGTDIESLCEQLERALRQAIADREQAAKDLVPYENARRALIEHLRPDNADTVRGRLEDTLALQAQVAMLDERIRCLQARIEGLRDQKVALRDISAALAQVNGLNGSSIDGAGAAANQAVRQLFHLIGVDHETSSHAIFEGPMQRLSDAVLQTELVGRSMGRDSTDAVASMSRCRLGADAALRELHQVMFHLHPHDLATDGLVVCVRRLLDEVGKVPASHLLVLGRRRRLRPGVEMAAFRIVQEAVTNAVRHSGAAKIEVIVLFQPERLAVVVTDDGEGFDVHATEARLGRGTGLGLITMRQRATIENGRLDVRGAVGEGVEVRAAFNDPD